MIVIYYLLIQFKGRVIKSKEDSTGAEDLKSQSIEYASNKKKPTNKNVSIKVINATIGRNELSLANTYFSNINKAKAVWWFDILSEKFSEDLHLILRKESGFIWVKIPGNTITDVNRVFRIRDDNGRVQLVISSELGVYYLRDIASKASGFNFEHYVEKEFD